MAGVVTTGGNPDWARTHGPGDRHRARSWRRCCAAGARMVGKTQHGRAGLRPDRREPLARHAAATRACRRASPAGRAAARSPRWPAAWCRSRSARTPAGRCASRRAIAASTACGRRRARSRWPARCRWRRAWTRRAGSRASAELLERVGAGAAARRGGPAGRAAAARRARPGRTPTRRWSRRWRPALERLAPLFGPALPVELVPEGVAALYARLSRGPGRGGVGDARAPGSRAAKPALSPAVAARFRGGAAR